jgi:tetratricopeptide (TPR) repeat protein
VLGLPTILVVNPDGLILDRLVGYRDDRALALFLEGARISATTNESLLEKAQSADGKPDVLVRVGQALVERGRDEEGEALLEQAISAGPEGSPAACRALMSLASAASRRGEHERAASLLSRAAREASTPELLREAFTSYIAHLRDTGSEEDQRDAWSRFSARLPDDPTVQEDYARALEEWGDPDERVVEAAERAIHLYPDAGAAHALRARSLFRLGRIDEAFEVINVAIELEPEDVDARILRLRILEKIRERIRSSAPDR